MKVFVTGATGWVGSRVVQELLTAGHQVLGLARSEDKAAGLARTGARVLLATLDDLGALADAARQSDAVIHLAFNHDFSRFADNARQDQRAIEVLGEALTGTDKPLLVTSGVARLTPGRVPTEADMPVDHPDYPRRSESAAMLLAERGVRAATVRLPPSVHGVGDHGFVPFLIQLAREKGVSAYLGEGTNRWSAVHVSDAGRLYRLALEHGVSERTYHAIAEEGVALRDIARVIGRRLGVPVEPRGREHFGWLANFSLADMPASSERTRSVLGWHPSGPALLADIEHPDY
ncbi:SDR family oxidoreductase [Myxococcus sp. K38C18041901]|uniref:SDR family oxidoreductase n=1 Tax=Myxococcus guangdongensis TaxID=2906760 RepID=UPI0020A7DDFF|nr:SDR family oxidoreductase [Myxococcus guangdongensis]MCP3063672.1 SDR family oxidoreductase [Myxococcus guangdongensis]